MHFLLWTKGSHENTNFDIFKCSDENLLNSSCHFPNHKSVFLQILHDSSVSWNILPCTFLCQMLYTLHKRDQSKCKFFRLFSARIKIHQVLVIFEKKTSFSSNFALLFDIMRHNSSILYLSETLYTFSKSSLSKYKFGEISPEQLKVWNFALWWAPFVKIK